MNSPPLDPNPSLEFTISSDLAEAHRVQEAIEQALVRRQASERDLFCIKLALDEALVNAMKHGNQMDRSKRIHISCRVGPERFECRISDEGSGFDPEDVPDPRDPENLERPCGRGVMLMRHYMNEVVYSDGGNTVSMWRTFCIK